jgi:hypothetical protein
VSRALPVAKPRLLVSCPTGDEAEARDLTKGALESYLDHGRIALKHMPKGQERDLLETFLAIAPGRFDQLAKELERSAGDRVAVYHCLDDLLWATFMSGAASRVLPGNMAKLKAVAMKIHMKIAQASASAKARREREEVFSAIESALESSGRRPATTEQCAADIRPGVLRAMGRPKDAKKPALSLIRQGLRARKNRADLID